MALELKKKSKIYLKSQKVGIEDNSPESAEFFGVVDFPKYLGEGKNSFKIRPVDGAFLPNTKIEIEVLDSNERPIYWEIPKYKEEDKGRLISVWIYDLPENRNYNTPNGTAQIILLGTLPDGNLVRWSRKIDVNKSRKSVSNIVFNSTLLPRVNVSSSIETFTNKKVSNSKLTKTIANSEVYYKKSTFGDTTTLEYDALSNFNAEMVSGTVYAVNIPTLFPRLGGGQPQPTQFTASITEVASSTIMRINTPITASDNRSDGSIHTYEYSDGTLEVNIEYYSTGSDTSTQNQIAFANFTLTNVKPIVGRIDSINTLIKSQGLTNADYDLIGNTKVENTPSLSYKVPIPTEHLKDPKSLKLQFLNSVGEVSSTELVVEDIVFEGGNVYIGGDQSLISGSFHIGNAIGTGIEMAGHSSGYLKSIGYNGFTSASLGKGAGGFLIWSGSGNLQLGDDQYPGVGMEMVSEGGSSSFYFTTHDGGQLKVITDEFFIGTDDTQFISGSGGNIEISSSFFHLNPKDGEAVIGGFEVSETQINSSNDLLILKSNGHITASNAKIDGNIIAQVGRFDDVQVVGTIAKDSSNEYILESWVTSSADITSSWAYGGSKVNVGTIGSTISYGNLTWTCDSGSTATSTFHGTILYASKYTKAVDGSDVSNTEPPTFKKWSDIKGNIGLNAIGMPTGYPEEYTTDATVDNVIFSAGNSGIGETSDFSILSEVITLPSSLIGLESLNGLVLQTAAKFGSSFGGFGPTVRVEIKHPTTSAVWKRFEITSLNAAEWLSINVPILDALVSVSGTTLTIRNQFRIKISWYAQSASGGGTVNWMRLGEIRLVKAASSEALFVKGLQFDQSSLSTTKYGTAHHGNFIPGRDNTYDLGQIASVSTGVPDARWDDVYATNGTIQTSDVTQKENITSSDLGLSFVNELRPVSYNWVGKTRTHYGLIAQELSSSLGQFDKTTLDFAGITTGSMMGLRYTELISPMIKAIQELSDEVNQLKIELSQSRG